MRTTRAGTSFKIHLKKSKFVSKKQLLVSPILPQLDTWGAGVQHGDLTSPAQESTRHYKRTVYCCSTYAGCESIEWGSHHTAVKQEDNVRDKKN